MQKNSKIFLFGTLLLLFLVGCSDEKEDKVLDKGKEIKTESTKLIDELNSSINLGIVYAIDDKKYNIDSLPKKYKELNGKARKVFLDSYLSYKITLDALSEEQKKYKKILDKIIKTKLDEISYRGINQNELDKAIYIQKIKLEQIALEEVAKKEENLTQQIAKVYSENQDSFEFMDTVELSFILLKEKEKATEILKKMDAKKIKIEEFARVAKNNSLDKPSRYNDGYAGYMTKKSGGAKLFDAIWNYPKLGLLDKVLEKDNKYLLVFIHKKIKSGKKTLNEATKEIEEKLLMKKRNVWINKKYQKIMKKTKIKIYDSFENNQTF